MQPKKRISTNSRPISTKTLYPVSVIAYLAVCTWLIVVATTEGQANLIVCPSKLLYHLPCPGCGITRATLLFFRGHLAEAILLNPNVLLAVAFVLLYPPLILLARLTNQRHLQTIYTHLEQLLHKPVALVVFLSFELGIWILNAIRGI